MSPNIKHFLHEEQRTNVGSLNALYSESRQAAALHLTYDAVAQLNVMLIVLLQ